ncbi:hypothetical protein FQN57_001524 [Myotisia sp. PD_48]|nr:hypothetical protein FQN57_001524 [Myotisia sp. PD_48]
MADSPEPQRENYEESDVESVPNEKQQDFQQRQPKQRRQPSQLQQQPQQQNLPVANQQPQQQGYPPGYGPAGYGELATQTGNLGGRSGAIRESRIKDRPQPKETRDSSLKVKVELDLEVEVDLYARVKGDITIGLL